MLDFGVVEAGKEGPGGQAECSRVRVPAGSPERARQEGVKRNPRASGDH